MVDKRKGRAGTWEYRVRWKGYGPEDDTWEPPSHLSDTLYEFAKNLASSTEDLPSSRTDDTIQPMPANQQVDHEEVLPNSLSKNETDIAFESDTADTAEMTAETSNTEKNDLGTTRANEIFFNDIERVHVHDPQACQKVRNARLNGIPVVLVGHTGWAQFARTWLTKKEKQSDQEADSADSPQPLLSEEANKGWLDLTQDWEVDTDKMIEVIGNEEVPVVRKGYKETNPIQDKSNVSTYLNECWNAPKPSNPDEKPKPQLYLHQWQFPLSKSAVSKLCGEGRHNPLPNDIFGEDLLKYWLDPERCMGDNPFQYIFMGREETLSRMHRDLGGLEITICPIVGEKEVILVHRADGPNCLYHLEARLDKIDLENYPMAAFARSYKSVIQAGEILLMPAGTYHQCRNITPCLSYSRFHLDSVNLRMFLESMIDGDATEISHQDVLWNASTELFHWIDDYVKNHRSENKKYLGGAPPVPPGAIARKVEALRSLRHICREIERRCEVRIITRGSEEDSCSQNCMYKASDWAGLIRDVDLTLHDFKFRNDVHVPPFPNKRQKKPLICVHEPGESEIEKALCRYPKRTARFKSLPAHANLCVGDEVAVEFKGRVVPGAINRIESNMDAAFLKYEEYPVFHDEFLPLEDLRMPVEGESTTEVNPEAVVPGKRVVFRHGRDDSVSLPANLIVYLQVF